MRIVFFSQLKVKKQAMNIKYIILFCTISYVATVNSGGNENIKKGTPAGSVYSLGDVILLSNKLVQVKINDCGKLLTSPDQSFPRYVKHVLDKNKWPTKLVDDIVEKYKQSGWPSGISCQHLSNDEKERRIKDYICRRIPGFVSGNREEAVIVMATDNRYMPADSIGHPGFLMVLNPGALNYINVEDFNNEKDDLKQVKNIKWDLLLTVPDRSLVECVQSLLMQKNWPQQLVDAVVGKYDQSSWPSGISGTQLQHGEKKRYLKKYLCRRVPGFLGGNQEQAVVVFASDNAHMPADMIAEPGFLMIFGPGALSMNSRLENILLSPRCPVI